VTIETETTTTALAEIVRRPSGPHAYGARILTGRFAGIVYCLEQARPGMEGRTVEVAFVPEDQFARITGRCYAEEVGEVCDG
jgi:hypothetical protein